MRWDLLQHDDEPWMELVDHGVVPLHELLEALASIATQDDGIVTPPDDVA